MATSNKYNIVVKAVLNNTDLYQQIKNIEKGIKPINIPVNIGGTGKLGEAGNKDAIENQITRWKNKLSSLESLNKNIFSGRKVSPLVDNFKTLMNTYDGTKSSRDKLNTELNNITTAFGNQQKAMQRTVKDGDSLSSSLTKAAYKMMLWKVAGDIVFGTLKKFEEAKQYGEDLNKELTKLQFVTGQSSESVYKVAQGYNTLAAEMHVTTLEVAQGSLEWARQGKTAQESLDLTRESIKLAKLGNLDAAQATEYLTSTLNGFKLEAKDAAGVVDKLIQLDNNYATSAGEIASALQRSSNSAQQAGVGFDKLAAYITVVSSVTRKSAIIKFGAL
jgi:hypothetical protein